MSQPKVRYHLRQLGFDDDPFVVERVEVVGEFENRAAARQYMIDTEDERKARDAGEAEVDRLRAFVEQVAAMGGANPFRKDARAALDGGEQHG